MPHQLHLKPRFGTQTRALIVDSYPTARSLLASHLRSLGIDIVTQCGRASEARQQMAVRPYDLLICEHRFADGTLGQDLIDDMRRRQMLSLATVVLMVSSESTYQVVAQVAESALDSFVIKPYSVGDLEDRVLRAYVRKESLKGILDALQQGEFAASLALCAERFHARGPFWTSAARIGAELAIREGQLTLATSMFEAVIQDRAVPWAKLGIARTLEADDKRTEALSTLETLLSTEPNYADAYDVMGRIYTEQGNFPAAINAYRQACAITPGSVMRAQKYGILSHCAGEAAEALVALERAVQVGLESPQFDHQTLLLLAICHYRLRDAEGLRICCERLDAAVANFQPGKDTAAALDTARRERLLRMSRLAQCFAVLLQGDTPAAILGAGQIAETIMTPGFDAEAANNLLSLLSAAVDCGGQVPQAEAWARQIGLRFCVSKHATEVLVKACEGAPPLAELQRAAHAEIGEATRSALSEGLSGNYRQAAETLIEWAERTLNAKLLEVAEATMARYKERIAGLDELEGRCEALRQRCGRVLRARLLAEAQDPVPAAAWSA